MRYESLFTPTRSAGFNAFWTNDSVVDEEQ